MPSSTSSSETSTFERALPVGRWVPEVMVAVFLSVAFVIVVEAALAKRGFRPTVSDSSQRWMEQRARASALGDRALILVGASRIQLDIDLQVLRHLTGLEPVQLAVDGSSFVPVLEELAGDSNVTGMVLVEFQDHVMVAPREDRASALVKQWKRDPIKPDQSMWRWLEFEKTEELLTNLLQAHLRSYADGASPINAVTSRLLDRKATPQYLVMSPNRSRSADYRLVEMPSFYYRRVLRNLGKSAPPVTNGMSWSALDVALTEKISTLKVADEGDFPVGIEKMAETVRAIQSRGGAVYFVSFPTSGLVRELDQRRFPREVFWDRFVAIVGAPSIHSHDVPALNQFVCPDGSHLDFRDQANFTESLVDALGLSTRNSK